MDLKEMKRKWLKLAIAIPLVALGAVIAFFGNTTTNPFIIVLGFAMLSIGVMTGWNWWQQGTIRVEKDAQALERTANSLVISKDYIKFTHNEKPLGYQSKCRNDNKLYYVMIDLVGELIPFTLPDEETTDDPKEFANPVTMPCNKKYYQWFKPEFQKISTIVLGVTCIFELIALIALGG